MKRFTFIKNAAIMTITAFILRGLGVLLRVYLSKKIGAEGMGLYQIIFSVYMLAATFATAGVSTAVIRIISDEIACGTKQSALKLFKKALITCISWGILLALIMYYSAEFIGKNWINDVRTIPSLKILIFALPFMASTSCIKGYFIAYRRVSIPSEAQILEQIIRIILVFFLIDYFIPYGIDAACIAIIISDVLAEMSSCIYSYIAYLREKKRHGNEYLSRTQKKPKILKKALSVACPVALNKYLNTSLRTFENILVPECLRQFSSSREKSLEQFGMLKGMAMPILFFPASLLTAFSTLLIPEMSEANILGQKEKVKEIVNKTLQISLIISILIGGLFLAFPYELAELIYNDIGVGFVIYALAPIVPFMYLETVVTGILQGLNQQMHSLAYNIFDSIIRISLIYVLVPQKGLNGFLFIMILSNIITSSFNIYRTLKVSGAKIQFSKWIIIPIIALMLLTLLTNYLLTPLKLSTPYYVAFGCLFISISYFIVLFFTKCLSIKGIRKKL